MSSPQEILGYARTVAVVGASENPGKSAHRIPVALAEAGFRIIPVNPTADEVFGEQAYATLADVPDDVEIDVVDVFRPSDEAPDIARQAAARGARALWLQAGITSDEARTIAEDAGMDYVEDLCMGTEQRRSGITKPAA